MKLVTLLSSIGLATLVSAGPLRPQRRNYAIKESAAPPRGWSMLKAAAEEQIINLQIALKQSNVAELERQLLLVSDPDSPSYGQHLTPAQTHAHLRPSPSTLSSVENWLASHGILPDQYKYSQAQDWIFVRVPVGDLNYLLDADYHVYTDGKSQVARVESYSLPLDLHDHIETIQPTTYFSTMKQHKAHNVPYPNADLDEVANSAVAKGMQLYSPDGFNGPFYCNSTVSVDCIRVLYRTANYTANPKNGNKLGVTAYLEEVANREDLQVYLRAQRSDAVGTTFTEYLVNNGTNPQENSQLNSTGTAEAGLDIQLATGIAYPTPVSFYSTGGRPPSTLDPNTSEPYLEWLQYVMAQDPSDVPQTISTSYGDDESSVPLAYATRVCTMLGQLGAQGVTLFFSSGDAGVGPANPAQCVPQQGGSYNNQNTQFIPSFPASCPWVTTVGGTQNIPNEAATTRFPAGGGFSNLFGAPAYQNSTVAGYLTALQAYNASLYSSYTSANLFNASGRAYPDLAGIADRWAIYVPGYYGPRNNNTSGWGLIGGTSSSSPAVAALFSQVNDYLIENNRPVLGFLNPLLYSRLYPAFNDITRGSSFGCGTIGFPALQGWDAVTGFGTPDFVKILDILKKQGGSS